ADTRVDWRVEESPEGSIFRIVHADLPGKESTCGRFQDAWRVCLGNLKAVAEARDDSLRPDSAPIPGGTIRLNVLIGAPRSKVFDALVGPALLARWTEDPAPTVEARVGGAYVIHPPMDMRASVLEADPGNRLALSWPMSGRPTHVTVSLESKGGDRSGLYFLQEGVAEAAAVGLRCAWSDLLVGLKNFLEAGETGFTEPYTAQVQAPKRGVTAPPPPGGRPPPASATPAARPGGTGSGGRRARTRPRTRGTGARPPVRRAGGSGSRGSRGSR